LIEIVESSLSTVQGSGSSVPRASISGYVNLPRAVSTAAGESVTATTSRTVCNSVRIGAMPGRISESTTNSFAPE
jgi:hypothetical protein